MRENVERAITLEIEIWKPEFPVHKQQALREELLEQYDKDVNDGFSPGEALEEALFKIRTQ